MPASLEIVQWELTRRCDLSCRLCFLGDTGRTENELSADAALELVDQMAEMGVGQVHLFGGEAYLRDDFLRLVRTLAERGLRLTFTTGGLNFPIDAVLEAGGEWVSHILFSIDGLEATHDDLRGRAGSFAAAFRSLAAARRRGVACGVTTQVNRRNLDELPRLGDLLFMVGIELWHLQLTEPFGRAAGRLDLLLQPFTLPAALDQLVRLKHKAARFPVVVKPGNNIGYQTERSRALRAGLGGGEDFDGCRQGLTYLAIQSDGTVKGCAGCARGIGSATANVRQRRLREIWEDPAVFDWTRDWSDARLWGFCADCPHRQRCRGGCVQTSQALFGRPGNNPYCDFRVEQLARRGRRERIVAQPGGTRGESVVTVIEEEIPRGCESAEP